ncbi:MAG TPA: Wzz/FepE/Etk N-terminal domain-containing protein [Candidatus Acidoferrum sp.]|nr:Wzz/FepE/Etk N-terminal domain-containing protein [Candidatus Acidoferrum sp.]
MSEVQPIDSSLAKSLEGLQLRDYWEVVCRRKWWIVFPAIACFIATVVAVSQIPNMYHSETVILVDPQKVPDSLVQSPVSGGAVDRLSTIRQLTSSPSRLLMLMDKLGLYPELKTPAAREAAIPKMQKNISIDVADYGGQRMSAFKIGFSSHSPVEAAKAANAIAAMVIEDNLKARAQAFNGAEQFLDSELDSTKKQLEAKETEVQRIRTQYVMDLPESKQFHLEALNNLHSQLRDSEDRVNQARQELVYLQTTASVVAPPTVDVDSGTAPSMSPYQGAIQKAEAQLAQLELRYGPEYPDVRKQKEALNELKAKAAQEAKARQADGPPQEDPLELAKRAQHKNPVVQAQVTKLEQEISDEKKRQADIQPEIDFHMSKLQREPIFQEQIAGLMRDYDTLRQHYNHLLDQKLTADMAMQLENRQQGERFVPLDEAPVPRRPSSPNRPLFSFAGLIAGLLGGFVLALTVEMNDESVRNETEAIRIVGKPILGGIPRIVSAQEKQSLYVRLAGAVAVTIVASAALGYVVSIVSKRFL